MKNIHVTCNTFFDVQNSEKYRLSDFIFENLNVKAETRTKIEKEFFNNVTTKNVTVNGVSL